MPRDRFDVGAIGAACDGSGVGGGGGEWRREVEEQRAGVRARFYTSGRRVSDVLLNPSFLVECNGLANWAVWSMFSSWYCTSGLCYTSTLCFRFQYILGSSLFFSSKISFNLNDPLFPAKFTCIFFISLNIWILQSMLSH
jgi:hypothetical protein